MSPSPLFSLSLFPCPSSHPPHPFILFQPSRTQIIFIFSIAYGLSVDYELFLISQIRESFLKHQNTELAILEGLTRTGSLITSAAIMLATTTFAFVGSQVSFIKFIGVGIAVSVVIDATVVRMLLVPSVLILMGDYNWYCPAWLARIIDAFGISDDHVVLEDFSGVPPKPTEDELKVGLVDVPEARPAAEATV